MPVKPCILVTGSGGQLGQELLQRAGGFSFFDFEFTTREDFSITDESVVNYAFRKIKPQYCINAAAYTAVDKAEDPAEKETVYATNATAPGYLAKASAENGTLFFHLSTDYVFDGKGSSPYLPDAPVNPQSVYGASKLKGEQLVRQYNPGALIIRTSWLYSSFGSNFVKTMLRLMKEKAEINVVDDQLGSPTWAGDLADSLLTIIEAHASGKNLPGGTYHYSNSGVASWFQFATAIRELSGSSCIIHPIPTSAYPTAAKRPAYSVLDTSSCTTAFGIVPPPWKESLKTCLTQMK